jgi:sensor histidine kinase YesM
MSSALKKNLIWALIAVILFTVFYWLFGLGMPKAAMEFATGVTLIILAGLLSGNYVARLWYRTPLPSVNTILGLLTGSAFVCLFLIGWFVSKMIEHTRFNYFFFTILALFFSSACTATIISLLRNRINNRIVKAQTALAQSKTELQLLQSQMSPHFLFNTLNNLYGLSLSDRSKVPGLILQLSELLRYSVYEAKEVFVPLADEVNYLRNYIEFEKIRLGDRLSLTLQLQEVENKTLKIAPMLLIVFVENAFKHSKNNEDDKVYIQILLQVEQNSFCFLVKNSYSPVAIVAKAPKSHSGLGLESVKKRLDLLYRNKHELKIIGAENTL